MFADFVTKEKKQQGAVLASSKASPRFSIIKTRRIPKLTISNLKFFAGKSPNYEV